MEEFVLMDLATAQKDISDLPVLFLFVKITVVRMEHVKKMALAFVKLAGKEQNVIKELFTMELFYLMDQ